MEIQNEAFWDALDRLVADSEVIIDRPKGSTHPRYSTFVYPADYGYLKNTASMDGGEVIDVIKQNGSAPIMEDPAIRAHFVEEMADVLIYCISMANAYDVDIATAIAEKLEKNAKKYPAKAEVAEAE